MDEKKQNSSDIELDPYILLQLGSIHPTHLVELIKLSLETLISITGFSLEDSLFSTLRHVRTWKDLVFIDWQEMGEEIVRRGVLSLEASSCAVSSFKLLYERVELHYLLHQAYSSTTLRLYKPEMVPADSLSLPELRQACHEFDQTISNADMALHTGRRLALQFQRTIVLLREQFYTGSPTGTWWVCLQERLTRMRACAVRYEHMLERAFEIQGCINWYLSQIDDRPGKADQAVHAA
jgi:hypothetical protein